MTPQQIELVQRSWALIVPSQQQAAALFYARVFQLAPDLRQLFTTDITEQGAKLTAMIDLMVSSLSKFEALVPAVRDLGRRHGKYGVRPEHYDVVGSALLWTLQKGLGDAFTEETRDAWGVVYRALSSTMKRAAAEDLA